jgi:hypothetical protein
VDPTREAAAPPDGEQYGFQWRTIGSGLAVFWASWILTYLLSEPTPSWQDRMWASLRSALWIFFGAMMGMRLLRGFVSRARLSSNMTFLVVWIVAFGLWWVLAHP